MQSKIFAVSDGCGHEFLVRAQTRAGSIHVLARQFHSDPATQDQLVAMVQSGAKVIDDTVVADATVGESAPPAAGESHTAIA